MEEEKEVPENISASYPSAKEIKNLVEEARQSFKTRGNNSFKWRVDQLTAFFNFFESEKENLIDALHKDNSKPPAEIEYVEINSVKAAIVNALQNLQSWMAPKKVEKNIIFIMDTCEIRRFAFGTVLIIGTWNYAINLTLEPLVAAIAAGNSAVIKLSEITPTLSAFMAQTLPKYLDNQSFKFVQGEIPQTTALLEERFDLIFYTGNSTVARIIHRAASRYLTPVILELGGKSPVIVDSNVDLATTAKRIMWGKTLNSGQTCVAPDYVLVDKKIAKDLVEALHKATTILLGHDIKNNPNLGPIINDRHFNRLKNMLDNQLKVPGTKVAFGGETDSTRRFIAPTVLTGLTTSVANNPIMMEEIFGPLLPVIEYECLDDALRFIESIPSPLSCMPFSKDRQFIEKTSLINCGNFIANDCIMNLGVEGLPFGGVGESGMGNYHGVHGFNSFSRPRGTMIRSHGLEMLNSIRYQNVSYDRSSKEFGWLSSSVPSIPNQETIARKNAIKKYSCAIQFIATVVLLFLALYLK